VHAAGNMFLNVITVPIIIWQTNATNECPSDPEHLFLCLNSVADRKILPLVDLTGQFLVDKAIVDVKQNGSEIFRALTPS
jgi:hypothetical protein